MRISAVFLAVLLGALAYTNPGMKAFKTHVEDEAATHIRNEIGSDSWIGDALGGLAGNALASRADEYTTRTNYFVASVYAVDLDRDDRPELKWLALGNRFVQLETEQ